MDAAAITDTAVFTVAALGSSEVPLLVRWPLRRCRWQLPGRLAVRRVTPGAVMVASPMDTAPLVVLRPKVMGHRSNRLMVDRSTGRRSSRAIASHTALIPRRATTSSMVRRLVTAGNTGRPRGITTGTELLRGSPQRAANLFFVFGLRMPRAVSKSRVALAGVTPN
jgi:hypothetical protein